MAAVEDILQWRESLTTLADNHFFELIRMYLGEVKTPYNKQKLIEDLSAFLRKEDTKKSIIRLLTEDDLKILSAIYVFPGATQNKLTEFFKNTYSYSTLYENLMNLEERLLIYRHRHPYTKKTVFSLNPLLEEALKPYIGRQRLLEKAEVTPLSPDQEADPRRTLTPGLLAAFISLVAENPDLRKADGSFKKRVDAALPAIFPQYAEGGYLELLLTAFINLNLIRQKDSGLSVQWDRIKQFAILRNDVQYAYIAAASCSHFPRDILQQQTQLILDLLYSIPDSGFTRQQLLQNSFILQERNHPDSGLSSHSSRFAAILRASVEQEDVEEEKTGADVLIDNAIAFGLLQPAGKDIHGNLVFVQADGIVQSSDSTAGSNQPSAGESDMSRRVASIDGGFQVTILPGLSLGEMLVYAMCGSVTRYDTILQLDITRKAVIRCFDEGMEPSLIFEDMKRYLCHDIPQNLEFSFNDWFAGYNTAALFRGYVLRIMPEKAVLAEKNPEFAPYIKMTLAPGVFLVDFASDEEAAQVIANSGLDFIGQVRDTHKSTDSVPFAPVRYPKPHSKLAASSGSSSSEGEQELSQIPEGADEFLESLKAALAEKTLTKDQLEELTIRIERRVVVNSVQLRPDSVRPEKNEASGMDFLGKIHVIEHALASDSMLEVTYDGSVYLGQPLGLEKQTGDALLRILVHPEFEHVDFSVARTQVVRRIRGAIFKETFNG
ncbi:MAG: winged helix-turn-helix transcriptional regulator [Treponema sp.]|nr:winged helix-turn-helix transcriptional regulator [Candidatus Treponema caballi]